MTVESVLTAILRHADRSPDAPALWWRDHTVSYAELVRLAAHAYHRLTMTHPNGGPVALRVTKSPQAVALILACLAADVPFLLLPADLGTATLRRLTERADCRTVLSGEPDGDDTAAGPVAAPVTLPQNSADDTAPCFMLTTSGSTGLPKVVPLSRGAVDRFTAWAGSHFGLAPGSRVLNYAPLNFDLCLLDIWATLRAGGTVFLVDPGHAANPGQLRRLLTRTDIEVIQAVPLLYRLLREAGGSFPSVRTVILTGDHAPAGLRAALPELFPSARFFNVYGCTETNDSFCHEFRPDDADPVLPIGMPLPGVEAFLVADGTVVDGTGTGELVVRTPFQTTGYLGSSEADEERFVPSPVSRPVDSTSGNGSRVKDPEGPVYYRTGDVVRRDNAGRLTVVGRTDFQVKVRGTRVNLEQVERSLSDHGHVVEAAVVATPDEVTGSQLHAVVRRHDDSLTGLVLRQHCAATLSRAAIPSTIRFVTEPLPRTSTGKVDRRRLRQELQGGPA